VQNPHTGKKILVTGGAGLLGTHLLEHLLDQGYRHIRALRRPAEKGLLPESRFAGSVTWVEADILDLPALEDAMQGVDWVFHCAGLVSFDPKDAASLRETNITGTANIVNLCLFLGIGKLLHVSSVAALGRTKPGQTISETSKWERSRFNTRYGTSKFLGEQEVWRGIEEGLNAVIINPSVILGCGRWTDGPARFFPLLYEGFPFYPIGATALVDARDVARMMRIMMESPIAGERLIASAGHLTYKEFFRQVSAALGRKAPRFRLSPILQHLAMRYGQLKGLWSSERRFITAETVRQSSLEFFYDNTKSKNLLEFEYTPIEKTIKDVASAYLAHLGTN
jgi:nucleoside-diphosphate-sugar epimerase